MSLKPLTNIKYKFYNDIYKYFDKKFEKLVNQVIAIKRVANNNNIILKSKDEAQTRKLETPVESVDNKFCGGNKSKLHPLN